ncbi:hypothetical protein D3C86_1646750 [compost metagenome]
MKKPYTLTSRIRVNGMAVSTTAVFMVDSDALANSMASGTRVSVTHQNRRWVGDGSSPSFRLRVLVAATA